MRLSAAITRSFDYLKGVLRLSPGNHNGSIRLHMGRLLACLGFVSWHAFVYAVRCWRWLGNELFISNHDILLFMQMLRWAQVSTVPHIHTYGCSSTHALPCKWMHIIWFSFFRSSCCIICITTDLPETPVASLLMYVFQTFWLLSLIILYKHTFELWNN